MLDLCDATVGDRSAVIMASYEREPETQTKPRAHHLFMRTFHGYFEEAQYSNVS